MLLKPRHFLAIAFCSAFLIHLLILSRSWTTTSNTLLKLEVPLKVSLIELEENPEQLETKEALAIVQSDDLKTERIEETPTSERIIDEKVLNDLEEASLSNIDSIVDQPSSKSSSSLVTTTKIQTSLNSKDFVRFIESETENYAEDRPKSVSGFGETFAPEEYYKSPEELNPRNPNYRPPAYRTDYAIESKGKRTCVLKIVNLLSTGGGDGFVYSDCTPEKKFELDLNKPKNQ